MLATQLSPGLSSWYRVSRQCFCADIYSLNFRRRDALSAARAVFAAKTLHPLPLASPASSLDGSQPGSRDLRASSLATGAKVLRLP